MEIFSDDTGNGDVILALTQCVHMGPEFEKAEPFPNNSSLPLALYDSSACPKSLDMTEEEYTEQFRGKVAVWLGYVPSEISCDPYFFRPQAWYKRVIDAGAIGVVSLVPLVGHHAGTYFDYFSRSVLFDGSVLESLDVREYIPFIICSNPNAKGEGVYSQDTLTSFLDNWYAEPFQRTAPFNNASISIGNISISNNPWIALYQSTLYMVAFRVIVPLLYSFTTVMCVYFLYERVVDVSKTRRLTWSSCSPPVVALAVEALLAFFFFIFYAVDGWGSNLESPMTGVRLLFYSQLLLISAGTTVLVGLTFSDVRQNLKNIRRIAKSSSFIVRHRFVLIISSAVMMITEIVALFSRTLMSRDQWMVLNLITCLIALIVGVWFATEAHIMARTIRNLTKNATPIVTEGLSSLRHHIVMWTSIATVMLALVLLIGFFMTLHPYFLFRVENWGVIWFAASVCRATYTIAMILLLRLPRSQKQAEVSTLPVIASKKSTSELSLLGLALREHLSS